MNSKLPPKYTFLFLLLFIVTTNKGECALSKNAELYPAIKAMTGRAIFIYTPPSVVAGNAFKVVTTNAKPNLESYRWNTIGYSIV
jgi:hypothetical protein